MGCFDNIFDAILALEDNWNHNGATKFSKTFVENCRNIADKISHEFNVDPTDNNTIKFEFSNNKNETLEIEIFKDYKIKVIETNNDGRKSVFSILNTTDEKILEIVEKFYK